MSSFQLTLVGVFIFIAIIGTLIFAGILPGFRAPQGGTGGTVTLWGTLPADQIEDVLRVFQEQNRDDFTLVYVEKRERSFQSELVEALAAGRGPDLVLLSQDRIYQSQDKLLVIPDSTLKRRTFLDSFIDEGQLFLVPGGALGLPLYVNPLVLYFNNDLLANARLAKPPALWPPEIELAADIKALNQIDERGNVLQGAFALGQFNNIGHAKDILAMMMLQINNPLVARNPDGGVQVFLRENLGFDQPPASVALRFFNSFSDPAGAFYSWNSSLPEARDAFLRGQLAYYFGYASEWPRLREQNPQLNFDVAAVPQSRNGRRDTTFGRLTGVAILKSSKNLTTALTVAYRLTGRTASGDFAASLIEAIKLPPARRDLLEVRPNDAALDVFYRSAIISRAWLDPDPERSASIFRDLAENVRTGRLDLSTALNQAHQQLENLFKRAE